MHITLPIHVITGRRAIGWRKPRPHAGETVPQPIWPIAGGAEDDDTDDDAEPDDQGGDDDDDQDTGDDDGDKPDDKPKPKPPARRGKNDDQGGRVARLEKDLAAARKDAAKSRTEAKKQAASEAEKALATKVAKALGLVDDDEGDDTDPAKLLDQLKQSQSATTAAQEEAISARVEAHVLRTAYGMGVDGDRLLDSRRFCDEIDELDPGDRKAFNAALKAAIKEAAEKNPGLRTGASKGSQRSGGDLPGGPPAGDRGKKRAGLGAAIKSHYGT